MHPTRAYSDCSGERYPKNGPLKLTHAQKYLALEHSTLADGHPCYMLNGLEDDDELVII